MLEATNLEGQYRPNVAALIIDGQNRFLWCHSAEVKSPRTGYQVPQGGIEPGESAEAALKRELAEETGLKTFVVLGQTDAPIRYEWDDEEPNKGSPYIGQEQTYFLVKIDEAAKAQLIATDVFDAYQWVGIEVILTNAYPHKKEVYRQAYRELQHLVPPPDFD